MQVDDVVAGRFVLRAQVGEGGMGRVFRAHDRTLGREVAVKFLRESDEVDARRFLREGAMLAELSHPGIVAYLAHGRADGGELFLAMEWIGGETVAERLARSGLTLAEGVTVCLRAAEALGEAHRRGIVHRDVKPSNVLLPGGDPQAPKLIDFGIARRVHQSNPLTRSGMAMGTPGYMAPEQVTGARKLDARADVFALGCVLYECVAGRPAFGGANERAVQAKILIAEPAPLPPLCPEAPPELQAALAAMLQKDPGRRPSDGAAVAARLAALGPLPSGPRRSTRANTAAPTRRAPRVARGGARVVFTILAVPAEGAAPPEDRLIELGARLVHLRDGTLLATLEGSEGREVATRAARAALLLRDALPGSHIVLSGGPGRTGAPFDEAVDRGARILDTRAIETAFRGPRGEGQTIRLDDSAAALLRHDFEIRRTTSGWQLG